jgi:pimeloyl-ACP methyl ester carboxylesterase
MQWREMSAPGRGVRVHVRCVVDPPAPPVLLLHGLGVAGSVFQSFARRLLPHLAAVAPDLRGHGQSDAPPSGYAPRDYALDLAELIEAELASPLPVVGHSLGALVGLQLAELRTELVSWLVLLDPPLDPELRNTEVEEVFRLRHAAPGELEVYLLERNPGGGKLLAESLARLFREASDAAFETVLTSPTLQVSRLKTPTLIIQADPDRGGVLGDAAAQKAAAALGNARSIKIVGAPHALHASHAAEVAQAILEFGGYSSVPSSR